MGSTLNFSTYLMNLLAQSPGVNLASFTPAPYAANPGIGAAAQTPVGLSLIDNGNCENASIPPAIYGQITNTLSNCTYAQDGTQHHSGSNNYKFTKTVAAGTAAQAYLCSATPAVGLFNGLVPGHSYTVAAWVRVPTGGLLVGQFYLAVGYLDYTGTAVETQTTWQGPYATWVQLSATITVPTNATAIYVYFGTTTSCATGKVVFTDDISLTDNYLTPMLPGATLSLYTYPQPQTADFALTSANLLCCSFVFPPNPQSVIVPSASGYSMFAAGTQGDIGTGNPAGGIYLLDPMPASTFLISATAEFARCVNSAGFTLFDCSVDNAQGSNSGGVQDDLVLNLNPFVAGWMAQIFSGQPDPFYSNPAFGNAFQIRSNK